MEVDLKNRKVQNNKNGKRNKVHNNKTDITSNLVSHKLEGMETISENNVKSDISPSEDKQDEILYGSNKVSIISRLQARHPIPLITPDSPFPYPGYTSECIIYSSRAQVSLNNYIMY